MTKVNINGYTHKIGIIMGSHGVPITSHGLLDGIASIIQVGGNIVKTNGHLTDEELDAKAIYSDWAVIGNDLRSTVASYGSKER